MENLRDEMMRQLSLLDDKMIYRYLHNEIDWNARLVAILGARGVGKTTLLLQHIKQSGDTDRSLFVFADNIYFSTHRLFDLAEDFYKQGGRFLYIDEIHNYENWSKEIKNIYDSFPPLHIIYTGSSILDLEKGGADLSRRKTQYYMQGLSLREFVELRYGIKINRHSLQNLVKGEIDWPYNKLQPLPVFNEYLRYGYYPYFVENNYVQHLYGSLLKAIEVDIPMFAHLNVGSTRKLKTLLGIISASVPFKPNMQRLANDIGISRNDISDMFYYLEKAGLINQLRHKAEGLGVLGKVNKVYLNNTNLMYILADTNANEGNLRETFFLSATNISEKVFTSPVSDFQIGDYTFEVGGKNKKHTQLNEVKNGFVVKDNIEFFSPGTIPLYTFGLLY